jgi:hypothetical protein
MSGIFHFNFLYTLWRKFETYIPRNGTFESTSTSASQNIAVRQTTFRQIHEKNTKLTRRSGLGKEAHNKNHVTLALPFGATIPRSGSEFNGWKIRNLVPFAMGYICISFVELNQLNFASRIRI